MIENNSAGIALTELFKYRQALLWADENQDPDTIYLFCRKVGVSWETRDVSKLFVGMGDIDKSIADQYGVSKGTPVQFSFSADPLTVLSANSIAGATTINVEGRITDMYDEKVSFELATNDWVAISDYDNETEYRRISSVGKTGATITSLTLSTGLDFAHTAGETQIRFAFALDSTKDRLDSEDRFNGLIKVKQGFSDIAEYTTQYQGKVDTGKPDADGVLTLSCRDRVQELVDYKLTAAVEFDDRGVASVPTESGWNSEGTANSGSGTISDVSYNENKLPDVLTTEAWTITYQSDTTGFELSGSVSGVIDSGDEDLDDEPTTDWMPSGVEGNRRWTIDPLGDYGFAVTIEEGDKKFVNGDSFKLFTRASGTIAAVKGKGYTTNPIDTTNLTSLNPIDIVEYVIDDCLAWQHSNPETGTDTDVLDATLLATARARGQNMFAEVRGSFRAGSRAIDIIDDALKLCDGYLFSLEDDHLGVMIRSPFFLNSPTDLTLSADAEHADRVRNVYEVVPEPLSTDNVKNQITLNYALSDKRKTITVDDTDSQTEYGVKPLVIQAEDMGEYELSTRFAVSEQTAKRIAKRILRYFRTPLDKVLLDCVPHLMLAELGDTPLLFARDAQMSNRRVWVTGIRKNFATQTVQIEAHNATHLDGKYAKVVDALDPAPGARWDATGFIGSVGEERLGVCGHTTQQLDTLGNANGSYDAKLGKPDQWNNFVEDNYIVW